MAGTRRFLRARSWRHGFGCPPWFALTSYKQLGVRRYPLAGIRTHGQRLSGCLQREAFTNFRLVFGVGGAKIVLGQKLTAPMSKRKPWQKLTMLCRDAEDVTGHLHVEGFKASKGRVFSLFMAHRLFQPGRLKHERQECLDIPKAADL